MNYNLVQKLLLLRQYCERGHNTMERLLISAAKLQSAWGGPVAWPAGSPDPTVLGFLLGLYNV
jgi:hypothetical protein